MSCWHLKYHWKVSLTATHEWPRQGLLFLPHGLLTTPVPHTTATLPNLPQMPTLHTSECTLTMSELFAASASSTLRKAFCIGTAAVVIPASTSGDVEAAEANAVQGIVLPIVVERTASCMGFGSGLWMFRTFRRGASSGRGGVCHAQLPASTISTLTLPPDDADANTVS